MIIRKMEIDDIPSVVAIDNDVFSMKWDAEEFKAELEKEYAHYFVAEENGEILGFSGVWCVYDTADIEKIAVLPGKMRCGTGSALLMSLIDKAGECMCREIMLEVRASNEPALKLYKKYGFEKIGERKGYYNGEDAVIMRLNCEGR